MLSWMVFTNVLKFLLNIAEIQGYPAELVGAYNDSPRRAFKTVLCSLTPTFVDPLRFSTSLNFCINGMEPCCPWVHQCSSSQAFAMKAWQFSYLNFRAYIYPFIFQDTDTPAN